MNTRFAANGKTPSSPRGSQVHSTPVQVPLQYAITAADIKAVQNGDTVLVADGTYLNSEKTNRDLFGRPITASEAGYFDGGGI